MQPRALRWLLHRGGLGLEWLSRSRLGTALLLLAAGVAISTGLALLACRYGGGGGRPAVYLKGEQAAARGWPARTPHAKPWPAVAQWSTWAALGVRRVHAISHTDDRRGYFTMEVETYGWPLGALVRRTYAWPQGDPQWASRAPEDTGYFLDPTRLAVETALYTALTWLALCGPGVLRWWRRRRRGLCLRCGYNLFGNVSGRCPECGTPAAGRAGG